MLKPVFSRNVHINVFLDSYIHALDLSFSNHETNTITNIYKTRKVEYHS